MEQKANQELKLKLSVTTLCSKLSMSRENFYKVRRNRKKHEIDADFVVSSVHSERRFQPRIGGRKLHYLLSEPLAEAKIFLGRDRLFGILRDYNLLVPRKKSEHKTTNSRHCLPVFHNLIKDMEVTGPNQVWVSDLTYIRTWEGFMYAALITDLYSKKIVGAHIGDNLEACGCIAALDKALLDIPSGVHPIHHSDRGSQYCCHEYVNRLHDNGLSISMTEENHCYENAVAERVNGILKDEFGLDYTFKTKAQAEAAFYQAVDIYNYRRPHLSLKYRFPADVHKQAV